MLVLSHLRNHQSSVIGFVLQQCPTRESRAAQTSQTEGGVELRTVRYTPQQATHSAETQFQRPSVSSSSKVFIPRIAAQYFRPPRNEPLSKQKKIPLENDREEEDFGGKSQRGSSLPPGEIKKRMHRIQKKHPHRVYLEESTYYSGFILMKLLGIFYVVVLEGPVWCVRIVAVRLYFCFAFLRCFCGFAVNGTPADIPDTQIGRTGTRADTEPQVQPLKPLSIYYLHRPSTNTKHQAESSCQHHDDD